MGSTLVSQAVPRLIVTCWSQPGRRWEIGSRETSVETWQRESITKSCLMQNNGRLRSKAGAPSHQHFSRVVGICLHFLASRSV